MNHNEFHCEPHCIWNEHVVRYDNINLILVGSLMAWSDLALILLTLFLDFSNHIRPHIGAELRMELIQTLKLKYLNKQWEIKWFDILYVAKIDPNIHLMCNRRWSLDLSPHSANYDPQNTFIGFHPLSCGYFGTLFKQWIFIIELHISLFWSSYSMWI